MLALAGTAIVLLQRDPATVSPDLSPTNASGSQSAFAVSADGSVTPTEPMVSPVDGSVAEGSPAPEAVRSQEISAETAQEAAFVIPIPIPAELAPWLEEDNPGLLEFHRSLEREPRDSEWAQRVETDFRDFIDGKPGLANIDVATIECRTTNCEILAVGYGDAAFRAWMTEMSELFQDEWLEERFTEGPYDFGCGGGNIAPGVMALNCVFQQVASQPAVDDSPDQIPIDFLIAESSEAAINDGSRIPIPEEMIPLFEEDRDLIDLHLRMESEPIDHSWSIFMEDQITEYLSSRPALESINIVRLECRTTLCQIQVTSQDEAGIFNWTLEMPDFYRQSWHDLVPAGVTGGEIASDTLGMIWILERRSPEQQRGREAEPVAAGV
jgi:hypothetical protein